MQRTCLPDIEWEKKIEKICHEYGVGAQFGGKYFVHDVRVIRLPRHAASCLWDLGVVCSADRNLKAYITEKGIFMKELEKILPVLCRQKLRSLKTPPG